MLTFMVVALKHFFCANILTTEFHYLLFIKRNTIFTVQNP